MSFSRCVGKAKVEPTSRTRMFGHGIAQGCILGAVHVIQKGMVDNMQKNKSVWSTLAVGVIAGTAAGLMATGMTSDRSRRKIKRQAEQAMRTMGDFTRDLTDLVK